MKKNGTRQGELEAKMDAITREHIGPEISKYLGLTLDNWEGAGNYFRFRAQPLNDIHLNPAIQDDMEPSGDRKYVYIFTLVALFIVAMACINFMNLSTARSAARAREVGMRKLAGSGRGMLVRQFLAESFVMVLIAMLFALLATEMLLPVFNKITRLNLSPDYFGNWYTVPGLIVFSLLVGIMAGSYPAFFLASFSPISVIGGKFSSGIRSGKLRSLLVVLQFGISIFIILCTIVITKQLKYLLNKDLGFDSGQIVVVERFNEVGKRRVEAFKQEIAKIPGVISSATSTMVPGHPQDYNAHLIKGRPSDQNYLLYVNFIDYDFPETYGLKLVKGRFHSRDLASDSEGIVINETAVRNFNIEDPLGCIFIKPLSNGKEDARLPVIGVMKDIHIQSLQTEVMPYLMRIRPSSWGWIPNLSIRLETRNYKAVLDDVEKAWNNFTTGQPFRYFFLDDDFEQHYAQEKRTRIIFLIFSVFAIIVASLGLLGLTSYTTERRAREIGIRKALGSTSARIVRLLSREMLLLVGIATLIAWPAAWYFSRNWLNDFAYRIDLKGMPFLVSLVIAILIAVLTTSFQAVRAALRNPADSLRYE
jgi:putative ABC transport system permease protein